MESLSKPRSHVPMHRWPAQGLTVTWVFWSLDFLDRVAGHILRLADAVGGECKSPNAYGNPQLRFCLFVCLFGLDVDAV